METIPLECPSCGAALKIPSHLAGGRGTCPRCRGIVEIPRGAVQAPIILGGPDRPAARPHSRDPDGADLLLHERRNLEERPQDEAPEPEADGPRRLGAPFRRRRAPYAAPRGSGGVAAVILALLLIGASVLLFQTRSDRNAARAAAARAKDAFAEEKGRLEAEWRGRLDEGAKAAVQKALDDQGIEFKKQLDGLREDLSKADRAAKEALAWETKALAEKIAGLEKERDALRTERDGLNQALAVLKGGAGATPSPSSPPPPAAPDPPQVAQTPPEAAPPPAPAPPAAPPPPPPAVGPPEAPPPVVAPPAAPGGKGAPGTVSFPLAVAEPPELRNRIQQALGTAMQVGASDHFEIVGTPEQAKINRYLEVLEKAYGHYRDAFGVPKEEEMKYRFVMFQNGAQFGGFVDLYNTEYKHEIAEWAQVTKRANGFMNVAEPKPAAFTHPERLNEAGYENFIVHNAAHLFINSYKGRKLVPTWLDEGFAYWLEYKVFNRSNTWCFTLTQDTAADTVVSDQPFEKGEGWPALVKQAFVGRQQINLKDLRVMSLFTMTHKARAMAWSYVHIMLGADKIQNQRRFASLIQYFKEGHTDYEGLMQIYKMDPDAFQKKWWEPNVATW